MRQVLLIPFFFGEIIYYRKICTCTWGSLTWKIGTFSAASAFSPFRLHRPGPFAGQLHSESTVSSSLQKTKQKVPILTQRKGILITPL